MREPANYWTTWENPENPKQPDLPLFWKLRKFGDGYPETDVDYDHGHNGAPRPHAHDWGRPADGSAPTHDDRQPWRDVLPTDPQHPKAQP